MSIDNEYESEPAGAPEIAGFQQFEFALTDALMLQLVECLDSLETAPLDPACVADIPNGQGVYQLYLDDQLEYVGKTDTAAGLTTRLASHARKIIGRPNLRDQVRFKAVQVLVFSAMELETLLIRHYKDTGAPMSWQHSGFGSNDPGRQRDHTRYKESHFDVRHSIDVHEKFNEPIIIPVGTPIRVALDMLKVALPYNFRYDRTPALDAAINAEVEIYSVEDGLQKLMPHLPKDWQATKLPGYVILYPENREYNHGEVIARS